MSKIICPDCHSNDVAKKGFRKNKSGNKQKYRCCKCNKWFVEDDGFKRMRFKSKTITRALHLHENGLSLSKVQDQLFQHDGSKVTRWTISKWVKKYSLFLKSTSSPC